MNLNGTWINQEQVAQINLMYQKSDDYLLKYHYDGNDYKNEEIVPINRSNGKIFHIMKSTMFGNCSVSIIDEQNIIIGNTHFQKIIV